MVDQAEVSRDDLLKEAKKLGAEQIAHRGTKKARTLDDKPCELRGPYVPTAESELRARKIIALRKQAAQQEAIR
jgi:hypothetical protein